MNTSNVSRQPLPLRGTLSMVLSLAGLILVAFFASTTGYSREIITFAQASLLFLLGGGLASGLAGVFKREQPRWLSVSGLALTISIVGSIALFFHTLDD